MNFSEQTVKINQQKRMFANQLILKWNTPLLLFNKEVSKIWHAHGGIIYLFRLKELNSK